MTVSYADDVATAKSLTLIKLIFCRWRGSVFKLLWRDLLVYLTIYYSIHFIFEMLDEPGKKFFKEITDDVKQYEGILPISFVLGFYVSYITQRWWDQYQAIPWPFSIAVYVSTLLKGYDEVGRAMRRTIMRYVCLSLTMVFRKLSKRVRERFPMMKDLIDAGLLTKNELTIIENMDAKFPNYGKNWLPIVWAASLVTKAREEGRIGDDFSAKTIIDALNAFRGSCGSLMIYNEIYIPLVYTQVVAIAMYFNFVIKLFTRQFVDHLDDDYFDYFPFLVILEFVFYMGWLKVAETMLNPFGEDDDDFEINHMIDQNLQVSYLIVDEMHDEHPELLKDQYWDQIPTNLPDRKRESRYKKPPKFPESDIFNVSKTNSKNNLPKDVESGQNTKSTVSNSETKLQNDDSLIPKPTVISSNYNRLPDVEVKQTVLDRTMQMKRERESGIFIDSGTSQVSRRNVTTVKFNDSQESAKKG